MPPHRRGDADTEAFRRLIPCRSLVNRFNHSRAQVRRIRSGHGSLIKPNHPPRLRPSARLGNPDSDPTETALIVGGRNAESEIEIRKALEVNPSNVLVLNAASSIFASNGYPEEGAKLADKSLRIDPRATSLSLNTLKDAYFFARRFKDVIAVVSRIPEDARVRGSRLLLAFSYALLGQHDDAERARAAVLARYPTISAEQMLNEGFIFTRPQEQKLFLDGFHATNLPLCAADADLAKFAK